MTGFSYSIKKLRHVNGYQFSGRASIGRNDDSASPEDDGRIIFFERDADWEEHYLSRSFLSVSGATNA